MYSFRCREGFKGQQPILRENQIGWYFWELMIGINQTRYQWSHAPAAPADIFFQSVLYPAGTPYRQYEVDRLRSYAQVSVP